MVTKEMKEKAIYEVAKVIISGIGKLPDPEMMAKLVIKAYKKTDEFEELQADSFVEGMYAEQSWAETEG